MFSTRSLKLLALLGLTAVIAISIGASITSTAALSQSVQVLERRGSYVEYPALPSAARVRAQIPSDFIQPVVPYDASEVSPDDYIRAVGPHTIRDEIPSEFIYPLASDSAGTVHENIAERSFELWNRQRAAGNSTLASANPRHQNIAERSFELQDQLAKLRAATAQFHQTEAAYAAGYKLVPGLDYCFDNPGVGGMGVHLIKTSSLDLTVDALQPEAMVYQPGPKGQLQLVAVEYIVPAAAWDTAGNTQPPSVLGHNFHLNSGLGVYILHAWIWQENPSGMFQDWNPKVSCP